MEMILNLNNSTLNRDILVQMLSISFANSIDKRRQIER